MSKRCYFKGNWKLHFLKLLKKTSQRIYCLRRLRHFLQRRHLILFYHSAIRSIIEYASPAYHGCRGKLLDQIQNRCHKIICGKKCSCTNFPSLALRSKIALRKLFASIMRDKENPLHTLIPELLPSGRLSIPYCKTKRKLDCFKMSAALLYNAELLNVFDFIYECNSMFSASVCIF